MLHGFFSPWILKKTNTDMRKIFLEATAYLFLNKTDFFNWTTFDVKIFYYKPKDIDKD